MEQISIKTPNPKCRLFWCLIEFKGCRYSQSCWYFRPLLWTGAPQTFSLVRPPPLPCVNKYSCTYEESSMTLDQKMRQYFEKTSLLLWPLPFSRPLFNSTEMDSSFDTIFLYENIWWNYPFSTKRSRWTIPLEYEKNWKSSWSPAGSYDLQNWLRTWVY